DFYDNGTYISFTTTHFTAYAGGPPGNNSYLTIWDLTDPEGGSQTVYVDNNNTFYANYSDLDGNPITTIADGYIAWCEFRENSSGGWSAIDNMSYNDTSTFYEYSKNITNAGTFFFNVSCFNDGTPPQNYSNLSAIDSFVITPLIGEAVSSCGILDQANTVYTLTQNVSSSGTCFTIENNSITLDCDGYTINYSSSSTGYGINNSAGYDNITITNCTINQTNVTVWSFGIFLNESDDSTVEYCNMTNGKAGILVMNSFNTTIQHKGEFRP
ncbi:unnamed protein product, partial [marine sediment metagenome]